MTCPFEYSQSILLISILASCGSPLLLILSINNIIQSFLLLYQQNQFTQMSFFIQTQRTTNWGKFGTPSPCQYEPAKLEQSRKFACAPFGSTQKINRIEKPKNNPQRLQKQIGQQFAVNDMNIKIRAQQQISSMFKSETKRFNHNIEQMPGPGNYNVLNRQKQKAQSYTQFPKYIPFMNKPTVPSMPVDNLGFKEDQHNQMKKVVPKERIAPNPASYDVKMTSLAKGVVPWKQQKQVKKDIDNMPGPGNYQLNSTHSQKLLSSCFNSQTDRFGYVKKINPFKSPGPGQYNYQNTSKVSHNRSNEGYFNSKTTRFQKDIKGVETGPGMYFNDKKKAKSMKNFNKFLNRQEADNKTLNRVSVFDIKNKNPGPGEYRTNFGISYQLHKALLKKQTTDVLPKQKRQVFQIKESDINPGPGDYESKIIKKEASKGKLYKKTEVVKLKGEQDPHPSPMEYQNFHNTIQSKIKQMNSKLTLTEDKPFNTGAERFKHYSTHIIQAKEETLRTENTQMQDQAGVDMLKGNNTKKVKRLVMTTIKVRVPFGISANKFQEKVQAYEGPDYYNKPAGWIKPSFNIKGKLQ